MALFDKETQNKLDKQQMLQCPNCNKWFLKHGVVGSTVPTLKKHSLVCENAHVISNAVAQGGVIFIDEMFPISDEDTEKFNQSGGNDESNIS